MKLIHISKLRFMLALTAGVVLLGSELLSAQQPPAPPPPPPPVPAVPAPPIAAGPEEITRGPLHEAFGQPLVFNPDPGVIVPKKPYEPIEEVPPDTRPQGDNVVWIGGYWYWDDQRQDFLWISGVWRAVPPGRTWVPGYWAAAGERYQWVSGFWVSAESRQAEYLPKPPACLEEGPTSEQPSENHIWAPGCWVWRGTAHAWQAGQWIVANPDWVWVPASYEWTPSGYVFVGGYWDYPLIRRGLVFAPVFFPRDIPGRERFVHRPSLALNAEVLVDCLFTRPSYQHYYFGDYYAPDYLKAGVYPWFSYHNSRFGYDPLYAHQTWMYGRRDGSWAVKQRELYWERREQEAARPPHTWVALQNSLRQPNRPDVQRLLVVQSVAEMARHKAPPVPLERVEAHHRQQLTEAVRTAAHLRQERARWEERMIREGPPPAVRVPERTAPGVPAPAPPMAHLPQLKAPIKWDMPKAVTGPTPSPPRVRAPEPPQAPRQVQTPPPAVRRQLPGPEDQLKRGPQQQPPGQNKDKPGKPPR